jgi:hypothetical protein
MARAENIIEPVYFSDSVDVLKPDFILFIVNFSCFRNIVSNCI